MAERMEDINRRLTRNVLQVLRAAAELRMGAYREDETFTDGAHFGVYVTFSLMRNGAPCKGLVMNGSFYVSALDAGTMDGRDRQRMLVVAKSVSNV